MRRSSFLFRRNILSQVVARHGDRAPTMNLFTSNEEFEFKKWLSRLPTSDQLNELAEKFPVVKDDSETKDKHTFPFGALTVKGCNQMQSLGKHLRIRMEEEQARPLKLNQISASSSNYDRTQQSCQYLLNGLTNTHNNDGHNDGKKLSIHVPKESYLNPYDVKSEDKDDDIWTKCLNVSNRNELMRLAEYEMKHIKALLCEHLPGFSDNQASQSEKSSDVNAKFKWIKAADYFYCSNSHEDEINPSLLIEHSEAVLKHSASRFHHWYSDEDILRLASQPLLCQVAKNIEFAILNHDKEGVVPRKVPSIESLEKDIRYHVYLSHDVILLALHKSVEYLAKDFTGKDIERSKDWWPSYASAILFELHVDDEECSLLSNVYEKYKVKVYATPMNKSPPFDMKTIDNLNENDDVFEEFASFPAHVFINKYTREV